MTTPLHIDRRKAGLRVRDVFFAEDARQLPPGGADLLYFLQSPVATPRSTDFYTSLIDLRQDEEALLEGINKGVRYEIRRARDKDGLQAAFCKPDASQFARFVAFYDAFAASRELGLANRDKLVALRAAGALELAWIPDPAAAEAAWLCAHAYIVDGRRTRLYHSASPTGEAATADRQRIGRANKLLHWQALQHFKAAGIACYDMGGISMGEALKAIDDFKRSFGGELAREFNRIEAASLRGRLALALLALKERLRRPAQGTTPT